MSIKTLIVSDNPLNPRSYSRYDVEDVREKITELYPTWPERARLYHERVDQEHDVTPRRPEDVDRLGELEGTVYLILYPNGIAAVALVVGAVALATVIAVAFLKKAPNIPTPRERADSGSPNNLLGNRTNQPRLGARIPWIVGQVRATPDLIQVPYRVFSDDGEDEFEISYMCLGVGQYDILDMRDGSTPVERIAGVSVAVYGPFTNPNDGPAFAQEVVGEEIPDGVMNVVRLNEVDGQVLVPTYRQNIPSFQEIITETFYSFSFLYPNTILIGGNPDGGPADKDMRDYFLPGSLVTINGAHATQGELSVDLDGTYEVLESNETAAQLVDPASVNSDWNTLDDFAADQTGLISTRSTIQADALSFVFTSWIGPFVIQRQRTERVFCNFAAPNGLYCADGQNQYALSIDVEVGLTPCDEDGNPTGSEEFFTETMRGDGISRAMVGLTMRLQPTFTGRCLVRARMKDAYLRPGDFFGADSNDPNFFGVRQDEVRWVDCYSIEPIPNIVFGNVTTVHVMTRKTTASLAIKDRKFNMLVHRRVPIYISPNYEAAAATSFGEHIFLEACRDPYIGGMEDSLIDADGITAAFAAVRAAFGDSAATNFDYTFDTDNMSFFDTLQAIASACHVVAYRQGSIIKARPDIASEDATFIFNHRNILPGSQHRTINFGTYRDYDGVEVDYVDPDDDSVGTVVWPPLGPGGAVNPKNVEVLGLRSHRQAWWHAVREWHKIMNQNTAAELEVLRDAAPLVLRERVLISDTTRPQNSLTERDGEILQVSGLEITCNQEVSLGGSNGAVIWLQNPNGEVEPIPVSNGSASDRLLLGTAPSFTINTNPDNGPRTRFIAARVDDRRPRAFLLTEKEANKSNFRLKAINYSTTYYIGDSVLIWVPITSYALLTEQGPWLWDTTVLGAPAVASDLNGRGTVYQGLASGDGIRIDDVFPVTPLSYSQCAWVNLATLEGIHSICGTSDLTRHAQFMISGGGQLRAGHNNQVFLQHPWPAVDEWHFAGMSYDHNTEIMKLYLDGLLVADEEDCFQRTFGGGDRVVVFGAGNANESLIGMADMYVRWNRVLTDEEFYDLWRTTQRVAF